MSKEQMITKIYEKIADKTLSFGCKVVIADNGNDSESPPTLSFIEGVYNKDEEYEGSDILSIGHPVMIGDVIDYFIKPNDLKPSSISFAQKEREFRDRILSYWRYFRKPIQEQSDECIRFIYDLITT